MADDLNIIQRFVRRLVWRERGVLFLDIAGRALFLLSLVLVMGVLAAVFDWDRGSAAAGLTLLVGTGLWASVVLPLLLRWRSSGDPLRQARLAEASEPALRGRLITAVERGTQRREGQSDALLGLVARRAARTLANMKPSGIHRGIRQILMLGLALVLVLLPLPLSFIGGGPSQVARWWLAGFEASAAISALELDGVDPHVQVGDLVLRYTYPAYTGLESRVVENSTGDAQGPPGTQVAVTARSAEPIEAAGLVAYEQRFEAQVSDQRMVDASFTISADDGAYHVITWRGEQSQRSRDFKISAQEDLAPEVMLDGEADRLELAVDEQFQLIWRARDDYGVKQVSLRVDGRAVGSPVYRMSERKAEVFGDLWRTPGDLGLVPGQEVEVSLGASDNDTYSGSKVGVSRSILVVVLGPKGLDERSEAQLQELVSQMLTVLGDHLVDPSPIGSQSKHYAQWGEAVAKRYQPLQELVDREWSRLDPDGIERQVLTDVLTSGGELVRYTAVSFDPRSTEMAQPASVSDTQGYRDVAIEALEDGILAIDGMLRNRALAEVVEVAERMDEIGAELTELMAEDDPDALAMLAKLEQLEAMMQQLAEASAKLDEGGLKEFVNARSNEMKDLMPEIRKAIAEGRMDDAKKLMERLAKQLQQMAEGVRDTLERQQGEGDDAMQAADDLKAELTEIEAEQRELQEQVEKLRERSDDQQADEAAEIWKQIQEEAAGLVAENTAYRDALGPALRGFNEIQRAENSLNQTSRLEAAAKSRDLRGTRTGHRSAVLGVDAMYRGLQGTLIGSGSVKGPGMGELEQLYGRLERIEDLLRQLEEQQASPETAKEAQQLQQQQQQLQDRLQKAQQEAEKLGQEFPVRPKGMEESLQEAGQRMGEANQDLQDGKPMPAEGSQGAAADRVKEARESLEKAMKQAEQQQQQMDPSSGQQQGGKKGQKDEGGRDNDEPPEVEIPGVEDFQTPEEYRRALLEGMEGEVPEEYRAMKKRYFEELVRQ